MFSFLRLKVLQRRRRIQAVEEANGEKGKAPVRRFSKVAEYLKIREWSKRFEHLHNAGLTVACCFVGAFHPSLVSEMKGVRNPKIEATKS